MMKRVGRVFCKVGSFAGDLFKGPGNVYWDLGRIIAALAVLAPIAAALWNVHLGKEIDLGPGGLSGGIAAILTAAAVLIAAKDIARKKAVDE